MGRIRKGIRRWMAFLLAFVLCIGMMPQIAMADTDESTETVVYKQVTALTDITSGGDFVFVIQSGESYYALGDSIGSKITPQEVTVLNGIVTADGSLPVWTVAKTEDGVSLASGSSYLAYSSSTNFKSSTEADSWTIAAGTAAGAFTITNVGTSTRGVAYGVSQVKFGAYATSNSTSDAYVFDFLVFKAEAQADTESTVEIPSAAYSEAEKTVTFSCKTSGVTYYYSYEENGTYTALAEGTDTLDVSEHIGETLYYYAQKGSVETAVLSVELTATEVTGITDGTYVIWAHAYYKALSTTMTGSYYAGVSLNDDAATGSVTGYGSTEIWTVTVVSDVDGVKTVTIAQDGKYMGLNSSGYLTYDVTDNIEWELSDAGDGLYYMYNTGKSKYLEWYDKYSDWSTYYSISSGSEGMFALAFTAVDVSDDDNDDQKNYETDSSVVEDIAQWGGGGPYTDDATVINGDKYEVNDMKDSAATYQAVVSGSAVKAFTTGTSSGSTEISNWYMGGTGLGSGTDDYLQFTLSTAGWGDMTLSFRMRASASGSGEWQLQYSTDGVEFKNFTTGSYSCSYTSYSSDGSSSPVSLSGNITDGVAKTSIKSATYITFTFDVPSGAENADTLYIRMVPSTSVRASGASSTPGTSGTVRVDSVVLSGSPIVDEGITGYVQVSPDNSEDQAVGTELPSYEYYTRALDKGWHVAPTNNQDNHKGLWGDANTARTVALADDLSEDSIYDAMRNYRIYATEDNDLSIYYQLDGNIMGSILTESDVDDTVTLTVQISDPTDTSIGEVEVIVNGGYSLASQTVSGNEDTVTFEVSSSYSYYYIKITEADGDIAVTAPVWVGDVEAVGITSFDTDATLAVQGESLSLNLELYNNEKSDFEVESIVFTYLEEDEDGNSIYPVIHEADVSTINSVVESMGTASYSFDYTYSGLGQVNYYVTVTGKLDGETKVYSEVLQLSYVASSMVTNVVVDGSHYNDYVTGYYGGNMSDFQTIAGNLSIQLTVVEDVNDYYGEDSVLSDCALLVISAPAKYSGTSNTGSYTASLFEDEFIEAVAEYVKAGGSVIVCGLADYSDKYAASTDHHTAAQMNKLLAAIGSSMSLNDDEVYDPTNNGGQYYRLYPENFNMESEWLSGVVSTDDVEEGEDYQVYSQYSGCSVNVGDGTWLVKGFDTTYSVDSDRDGIGATDETETDDSYGYNIVTKQGEVTFLACEDSGYGGTIFAAGGVFCSDFEVDADVDDYDLPYANTTIITNILESIQVELDVTPIADVREVANSGSTGDVFRVQGYVTAGTANSDTSFFDCIYIQDETGGIDIFPYAESGLQIGAYVEVTGYLASYQGDLELKVISYEVLDNENLNIQDPTKLSCSDAMNYEEYGGLLIQVEGTVQEGSICYNSDGTVAQFVVVDDEGGEAKVFIDGYILSGSNGTNSLSHYIEEGAWVSAVGVLYMHPEVLVDENDPSFNTEVAVLRVRDCDEVIITTGTTYVMGSGTGATLVFSGSSDLLVADSLMANGICSL